LPSTSAWQRWKAHNKDPSLHDKDGAARQRAFASRKRPCRKAKTFARQRPRISDPYPPRAHRLDHTHTRPVARHSPPVRLLPRCCRRSPPYCPHTTADGALPRLLLISPSPAVLLAPPPAPAAHPPLRRPVLLAPPTAARGVAAARPSAAARGASAARPLRPPPAAGAAASTSRGSFGHHLVRMWLASSFFVNFNV
jgi:hypothetical protein